MTATIIAGGITREGAALDRRGSQLAGGLVLDCAVFGVPDAEFGESLHAVVQPAPGEATGPEQIAAGLRALISGYKVPRTIEITAALPRDPNGKIAKRKLREPHWAGQRRRI